MPIIFTVSATTPKMIAGPKTLSCKYIGRYTRSLTLFGTAGSSTCPLDMFFKPAEWKGRAVPRFTRIVDPDLIAQLEAVKARMYPAP